MLFVINGGGQREAFVKVPGTNIYSDNVSFRIWPVTREKERYNITGVNIIFTQLAVNLHCYLSIGGRGIILQQMT